MTADDVGGVRRVGREDARIWTSADGLTVPDLLRAGVARHPRRELLAFERPDGRTDSFSWQDVWQRSAQLAERLRQAEVVRGDRVHLHLSNRPEFLFAWFAAAMLGASIVPTNTASSVDELTYIVGHAGTTLSLTEAAFVETVRAACARVGDSPVWSCEHDDLFAEAPAEYLGRVAGPQDELGVIYTSGTTSNPKGVMVNHANYLWAGDVVAKAWAVRPSDRLAVVLPLFHANAQYYSTMSALQTGATLILLPRFSASRFIDQCITHRVTVASLFAAPIRMILAQEVDPGWRAHQLRLVLFAQNLSRAELGSWEEGVGAPLLQMYGMTETIGPPLTNPVYGVRDPDTIGRVTLGYSCRVIREDGSDAAVDEPGELLVGGTPGVSLTAGYLHDEAATRETIVDGWLRTGDVVRVDATGRFTFVDRSKDMIKRGGENVAASEIEAVVLSHPEVVEVAVVGVPDPVRDEAIVAFVVASRPCDPEDLRSWCAARLANFRVPSTFVFRAELPRTAVGKVQKHVLTADLGEHADRATA